MTQPTKPTTFPNISGYVISERLYTGAHTTVYRGIETASQRSVILKVLSQTFPSVDDLVCFRNQYAIAQNLNIPGVARPIALDPWQNGYVLVIEDFGGLSLRQYARAHYAKDSMPVIDVLGIALQLTDILRNLSQHSVIHKDIKPDNIIIQSDSKRVQLIDFSIASLLPKQTQTLRTLNQLEGTLAYLAPEQTGRMNRGIDYRADFYSLGITLYELLTGELPFVFDDPMALVHAHMAQIPEPLCVRNPEISSTLSQIVLKLMAKNAEDRYQSAIGLKHDLSQCLHQIKETGHIEAFDLGQQDVCDRFLIPEKLYGREREVQQLLNAFDRVANGASELLLVAGFSGVGKTAVVNEVHKPIVKQRGYFIKGKFDQFNRDIPFSAFVQAFRRLIGQLFGESDAALAIWREKILAALGDNGQVIIEVIPELEGIIGPQPAVPEFSGQAAQNRFNSLFQKFIGVFTSPDHPLVLFLDDLQWADAASLNLLTLLVSAPESNHLLLLGAYRDNEIFPGHPLSLTIKEIDKTENKLSTLSLHPLTQTDITQLVSETLLCSVKLATPLSQLVYQKTQGNPFFAVQFLQELYENSWITFNQASRYWQCDLSSVQQLALTSDVVGFMVERLQKFPVETQDALKMAACIGNRFDLETLSIVCGCSSDRMATNLWPSLQSGLIVPENEAYKFFQPNEEHAEATHEVTVHYRFIHDRVQQAAYSLIPDEQKYTTHYHIGQLLLQAASSTAKQISVFDLVSHLNCGISLVTNPSERDELTRLNLKAANKAKSSTAYGAALGYLKNAMKLLATDSWHAQYDTTLAIYIESIECAYLNGEFQLAEDYTEAALNQDIQLLDAVKIHELRIHQKIAEQKAEAALEISLEILEKLGLSEEKIIQYGQQEIALPQIEDLAHGHRITDPSQLATIRLLLSATSAATIARPQLLLPIVSTQVQLSLEAGYCEFSAFAYGWYGSLLCGYLGEIDKGYQAGQIALRLLEIFETKTLACQIMTMVYQFIVPWKKHLRTTLEPSAKAFQIGLENGDLLYASYSASNYCSNSFLVGLNLDSLLDTQRSYIDALARKKIDYTIHLMNIWKQLNLNLQGLSEDVLQLVGEAADERYLFSELPKQGDTWGLLKLHIAKELLLYLWGDYEGAILQAREAEQYIPAVGGWVPISLQNFYKSLSLIALSSDVEESTQQTYLAAAEANQQKMLSWAEAAPMNFRHKYDLVAAEKCRVLGENANAIDYYDRAIAGAKENQYLPEEALANELAAKFYLDWGKEKVAAGYMQDAYYCYSHWGAKAKVADLETRYPELLRPILQPTVASSSNMLTTLMTIATPASIHTGSCHSSSSTSFNQAFDFASILKASQALSSTIELDELLCQLTQIILQNSGGDRCALLLPNESGDWQVRAVAERSQEKSRTPVKTKLCKEALIEHVNLPIKLIQYVKNTQETVIINNLESDLPVIDDYLRQNRPSSLLCLPILSHSKLIGVLYLKNQLASEIFTTERVLILNFLCTQAAISLENARLYQQAQGYAKQLEQSQLQLVQSEKMSALGNLVAGVAHEINNPVGFLKGNIKPAQAYISDLLGLIDLFLETTPQLSEEIEEELETIDLEFIRKDLPDLLNSMNLGADRIKNISTSLRTFSRADKEHKTEFNLHEGLNSTILILKHRLKANEQRPAIEVVKAYGNLPRIHCFPGQLNQVFMNILANAIDVFDEAAQQTTFAELKNNPQRITISTVETTVASKKTIEIRIADNGKGMPEDISAKIFEHLFTTKGVGQGTGLGLAIARQIVTEKHGGSLLVQSELGQGTEFCIQLPSKRER